MTGERGPRGGKGVGSRSQRGYISALLLLERESENTGSSGVVLKSKN